MKPRIGITMGDPAGIGPEIICKALLEKDLYKNCCPVVIGNAEIIDYLKEKLNLIFRINKISKVSDAKFSYGEIDVLDLPINYEFKPGRLSKGNGKVALDYIHKAVALLKDGQIDATCSAPTNKEAMRIAGSSYTGATEMFADLLNVKDTFTVINQGGCYIFQLTTHIALRSAIEMLTEDFIFREIRKVDKTLKHFGIPAPSLGLSGLNPHAGDGGLLGSEETDIFLPAINRLRCEGINISNPLPTDTIFNRGLRGDYDAILFLFHDTANTAVKSVANSIPPVVITAGLPFIRTTVAHGTAYDISYKGIADYRQLKQAIIVAAEIYKKSCTK